MNQIKKEKIFSNAHIGPWFAIIPETYQTLNNVKESLAANVIIIKEYVKTSKPRFRNSILDEYK